MVCIVKMKSIVTKQIIINYAPPLSLNDTLKLLAFSCELILHRGTSKLYLSFLNFIDSSKSVLV